MNQTNELSLGVSNILKKWEECSIEDKLEKLRAELRSSRYLNNRVYNLESQISELSNHSHDGNGNVTVKMDLFKSQRLGGQPSSSIDNLA